MRIAKFKATTLTAAVILAAIISLNSGISLLMVNYTIPSSGSIGIGLTRPLHTEGKYIKDDLGQVIYLRGIWRGDYIDTTTGWWTPEGEMVGWDVGLGYSIYNEVGMRAEMQVMQNHGFNIMGTFIWADWWLQDASTSLEGPTDINYRQSLKNLLTIAQEYGLYIQIRLWGYNPAYGKQPGNLPWQEGFTDANEFVNVWGSIAEELGSYPNVLFCIYDEPFGTEATRMAWNQVATDSINMIRSKGFDGIIIPHWAFAGDGYWMQQWVDEGNPTYNIVFSNHIYRFHGTYDGVSKATDLVSIRNFILKDQIYGAFPNVGLHYNKIVNEYQIPVLVAVGAFQGWQDDDEYTSFVNTLTVLNELEIGYYAFVWHRSDMVWAVQEHTVAPQPLNRVGQALKDAIAAG